MLDEHKIILTQLQEKINIIITYYQKAEKELRFMKEENNRLEKSIKEKQDKIDELEELNQTLRVANSIASGEHTKDAKTRINHLVREIDKCIGLLNK